MRRCPFRPNYNGNVTDFTWFWSHEIWGCSWFFWGRYELAGSHFRALDLRSRPFVHFWIRSWIMIIGYPQYLYHNRSYFHLFSLCVSQFFLCLPAPKSQELNFVLRSVGLASDSEKPNMWLAGALCSVSENGGNLARFIAILRGNAITTQWSPGWRF
jgi:hypothetical protein